MVVVPKLLLVISWLPGRFAEARTAHLKIAQFGVNVYMEKPRLSAMIKTMLGRSLDLALTGCVKITCATSTTTVKMASVVNDARMTDGNRLGALSELGRSSKNVF